LKNQLLETQDSEKIACQDFLAGSCNAWLSLQTNKSWKQTSYGVASAEHLLSNSVSCPSFQEDREQEPSCIFRKDRLHYRLTVIDCKKYNAHRKWSA
jgi:hypothetical protein